MAAISQPHPDPKQNSLYCYDPNCPYCKELRATQERVRTGQPVQAIKRTE
jgi:hypothetical protein